MVFKRLLLIGFSAITIFLCQLNDNCSKNDLALCAGYMYTVYSGIFDEKCLCHANY